MFSRSISLISVPMEMTADAFRVSSTSSSSGMPEKSFPAACSRVPMSLICKQCQPIMQGWMLPWNVLYTKDTACDLVRALDLNLNLLVERGEPTRLRRQRRSIPTRRFS